MLILRVRVHQLTLTELRLLFFSLFRSEDQDEAETRFIQLKDKLPVLLSVSVTVSMEIDLVTLLNLQPTSA